VKVVRRYQTNKNKNQPYNGNINLQLCVYKALTLSRLQTANFADLANSRREHLTFDNRRQRN